MTSIEIHLALQIVKESFGEIAKQISSLLITKKTCPIGLIASELKLSKKLVAQILSILINHQLVEYKLNLKQILEYKFLIRNALNRLKLARTISSVRICFENDLNCELILKEILLHGSLEMSSVLLKILAIQFNENNLKTKLTDLNAIYLNFNVLRESFVKLVQDNFLERLPQLDNDEDDLLGKKPKQPKFLPSDVNRFLLPNLQIEELRIKKSIEEDFETVTSNIRRENENFGDNGVYWTINDKRLIQHFRDEALIEALENRIDNNAGKIIKSILKLIDSKIIHDKALQNTTISRPFTIIDLQRMMINDHKMEAPLVEKYLNVIYQDSVG